ncbi:phosphoenolpyruvate--protein phosphotransferase [Pseudomonadota bacterium]
MIEALQEIVQLVTTASDLQEALKIIVHRVKAAMNSDVCSVYVHDPATSDYVLMATEGLNPSAVGKIRMAANEGIVGLVATRQEPINLAQVADHPNHRLFPESGEQHFSGLLAVPLVHFRRSMGVLVVRQKSQRVFAKNEVAFLATIGAQLAAILSDVALKSPAPSHELDSPGPVGLIQGLPGAAGVAIGTIVLPSPLADLDVVADHEADDVAREEAEFRRAVQETQEELRASANRMQGHLHDETRAIFDAYILILSQDDLVGEVVERVRGGNWAPGALRNTIAEHARLFEQSEDPYLRARAEDIRAIGRRILLHLVSNTTEVRQYPDETILLGDEVSLARMADVPAAQLKGIVCLHGSVLSHTPILARSLGIPAVMGLGSRNISALDGHPIIVDGYRGRVFIDPPPALLREYQRLVRHEELLSMKLSGLRDLKALTIDQVPIGLGLNIGLLNDIDCTAGLSVDEVGLYRSEFPFMTRQTFPMEDEQYEVYREVLQAFAPKPVTMRTLDIGGDKLLSYFPITEENPFLGWRGIRLTRDRPDIFLPQLRAMLRANTGLNNLRIMFPMIGQVGEIKAGLKAIERARSELLEEGHECPTPPVGAMLEVPSALFSISTLSRYVDFFSIGTNDLTQYLLAVDRNNPNVASLYDQLEPSVIRALHRAIRDARRCGKPVSVCGEMAADPGSAILLLGMGLGMFSMSATAILRIKWVIRSFTSQHAKQVLYRAMRMESAEAVRNLLDEELHRAGLGELVLS